MQVPEALPKKWPAKSLLPAWMKPIRSKIAHRALTAARLHRALKCLTQQGRYSNMMGDHHGTPLTQVTEPLPNECPSEMLLTQETPWREPIRSDCKLGYANSAAALNPRAHQKEGLSVVMLLGFGASLVSLVSRLQGV